MKRRLCLFALLIRTASPQAHPGNAMPVGPAGFVVYDKMPLSRSANGVDGELQLMQDARLTPSLRKELWRAGDMGSDDMNGKLQGLQSSPLRNAILRIVKSEGAPTESAELERPLAKLERTRLYADSRDTYLVTVDYSAGFGSYSGPATFLLEIVEGRMKWLDATDTVTGKAERLTLAETLKSVWKIVAVGGGSGKEILQALCRPTFEPGDEFKLIYIRYHYDGERWVQLVRERKGYSDFEDGVPDRSSFP